MKKLYVSMLMVAISFTAFAQKPGDTGVIFEVKKIYYDKSPGVLGQASSTETILGIGRYTSLNNLEFLKRYYIGRHAKVGKGSQQTPNALQKMFIPDDFVPKDQKLIAYVDLVGVGSAVIPFVATSIGSHVAILRDFGKMEYSLKRGVVTQIDVKQGYKNGLFLLNVNKFSIDPNFIITQGWDTSVAEKLEEDSTLSIYPKNNVGEWLFANRFTLGGQNDDGVNLKYSASKIEKESSNGLFTYSLASTQPIMFHGTWLRLIIDLWRSDFSESPVSTHAAYDIDLPKLIANRQGDGFVNLESVVINSFVGESKLTISVYEVALDK